MKNRWFGASHAISGIFVFLLIGLFALMSVLLTLTGVNVYRTVSEVAANDSDSRMVLSYLGNKVRTFDAYDAVSIESRSGLSVLCLEETLEEERYETAIYAFDGFLWERFAPIEEVFAPGEGERLLEVRSLDFVVDRPNLLSATIVMKNGDTNTLRMSLRTGTPKEAS